MWIKGPFVNKFHRFSVDLLLLLCGWCKNSTYWPAFWINRESRFVFLHNSKNHKKSSPLFINCWHPFIFVDRLWRNEEFIHINQVDMVDYWFIVCGWWDWLFKSSKKIYCSNGFTRSAKPLEQLWILFIFRITAEITVFFNFPEKICGYFVEDFISLVDL